MFNLLKYKSLPNILTISRMLIIPIFILMVWFADPLHRFVFLLFYIYATVTDFLDGYLAREYNLGSTFGRIMDPIADKTFILIICIVLLMRDKYLAYIIFIPIIVLLARELIISGIREGLASHNIVIKVSVLGKYKTALQMISLGFLVFGGTENWFFITVQIIGVILLLLAMVTSVLSGFQYIIKFYKSI